MISEAGAGTTVILAVAGVGSVVRTPWVVEKLVPGGGSADTLIWVVPPFNPVNVKVPRSTGSVPIPSSEVSATLACVAVRPTEELSNSGPGVMLLVERTAAIPEGLLNETPTAAVKSALLGLIWVPPDVCDKKTWTWTVWPGLTLL
jgi:hypothetical protein